MNFEEHQEFAKWLSNPDYDCLEHWVPKMVTEVFELLDIFLNERAYGRKIDWFHVLEECGDFAFYRANIYRKISPMFAQGAPRVAEGRDNFSLAINCGIQAGQLLRVWSGDPDGCFPEDLIGPIETIHNSLGVILARAPGPRYTWSNAYEANRQKLLKRYPLGVFSAEKANNRDLEAEREALEG